jgi:hypothetical protein
MRTFILTCLLGIITVSGIFVHADPAAADNGKRAPAAGVCSEGKTASGECVNAGLVPRMRQLAGGTG